MFKDSQPEVLIAGAGPAGLFAALNLARHGVPLAIVDTGVWPCQHSYALALHPQTLALLGDIVLRDKLMNESRLISSIGIYDLRERRAAIVLPPGECIAVLRQDVLEEELEKDLGALGVQVRWRHEVASLLPHASHVGASVHRYDKDSRGYAVAHTEWVVGKTFNFDVPYVIGADGYNSLVRRTMGLDFNVVGPAAYYAVFEFSTDAELPDEMGLVFGDRTTDVLWPLPGGNCRWSFQLTNYADPVAERLPAHYLVERDKDRVMMSEGGNEDVLSSAHLQHLLKTRAPWFTGSVNQVHWRTVVRFERRLAPQFGRDRMWLVGDAAHLTGPAGIQSMNAGLAEARDLSNALFRILRRGDGDELLAAYNYRWLRVWQQLHNLKSALHPAPECDPWIASIAPRLTACLPAYGEPLETLAAQLNLAL